MPNDDAAADTTDSTAVSGPGRPRWLTTALVGIATLLIGIGAGLAIGHAKKGADDDHHQPTASRTAVGFSQDMITHHAQAVEMTKIVIERGADPKVRDLAVGMLSDQNKEIGQMTGWLQSWGAPLTNPGAPMSWMNHGGDDHCADGHVDEHCPAKPEDESGEHEHGHGDMDHGDMGHGGTGSGAEPTTPGGAQAAGQPLMEGMATPAEMDRLRSLTGPAADTYFLQLMLRHHQGGHHMMAMVLDPANGAPTYVRALAEKMNRAQTAEEATMTQLLAQRNAKPLG